MPMETTGVTTITRPSSADFIFINKDAAPAADFCSRLIDMFAGSEKKETCLKANAGIPCGDVVKAMADIKAREARGLPW